MAARKKTVRRNDTIDVFVSYSLEDEALRVELAKHLSVLQREGIIASFHVGAVAAGMDGKAAADAHLDRAKIVLLLVSASFLASDHCYEVEVARALDRHKRGEARVIPVLLRACNWRDSPFGHLVPLPENGSPIASAPDRDEAFARVAEGIHKAAGALRPPSAPVVGPTQASEPPHAVGFAAWRRTRDGRSGGFTYRGSIVTLKFTGWRDAVDEVAPRFYGFLCELGNVSPTDFMPPQRRPGPEEERAMVDVEPWTPFPNSHFALPRRVEVTLRGNDLTVLRYLRDYLMRMERLTAPVRRLRQREI